MEDKFRYNLPTAKVEYVNTQFETNVKEADLKQQILTENLVPDNLEQVKKLDDFVRDILKDKIKQKDLNMDSAFEKNQLKNGCVTEPLSKLWMLVEKARRSKEKQILINLDIIRAYIEQTVLLLGQISNYIAYFRRYNILAALNCPVQQSKEMLRQEADLLQPHDRNLFRKTFREHLVAPAKYKKHTIEIFAEKGKKKQKFFWNGPSEAPRRSSGGQHSKFFLEKRYAKSRKKYLTETIAQQLVEAVDSNVKINTKETFFSMMFPPIVPVEDLRMFIHG